MTIAAPGHTELPDLPHWETTPDDLPGAIRQVKAALRARIAASGRTVEEVFAVIEQRVRRQVEEIAAEKARGETVWPVIDYADIATGAVPPDQLAKLRQRGCLIVRGHFGRDQALGWDRDIIDYIESNRFSETYQGPADDFFGSVGSKPEIYPIYWSPAQMQARHRLGSWSATYSGSRSAWRAASKFRKRAWRLPALGPPDGGIFPVWVADRSA